MKSTPYLGWALTLSVMLHAAAIALGVQFVIPSPPAVATLAPANLKVSLRNNSVELQAPAQPELFLPRDPQRNAIAAVPVRVSRPLLEVPRPAATVALPRTSGPPLLEGEAALKAAEQMRSELPYPAEAIQRGLQGDALVLLFLDASGNAIAARLESSSGHALLDDAAVQAARGLRSLPHSAPREALVPVRFRLR
jgi:protein TonB